MQSLQAEVRSNRQKSFIKEQRSLGKIPGVVYGKNIASTPLLIDENELTKLIRDHGSNVLVQLKWDSKSSTVMIVDIQSNPLKENLVHVDFQEINLKQKTKVEVPLEWIGEENAIKEGAVLQKQVHTLEVETLPANIPDRIRVDVSELKIGDQLTIADIKVNEAVEFTAEEDMVIVSVLPPTLETDPEEPQIDESAEPELVEGEEQGEPAAGDEG